MKAQRTSTMVILAVAVLVLLALAGCQAPPAVSNTPLPTPTPTAPPLPDPKTDPQGALNYASESGLVKSMGFAMAMSTTLALADAEADTALGGIVAAALQQASSTASGTGVVEVIDSEAGRANMQMALDVTAAGQNLKLETIVLDDKAWTRVSTGKWTKADVESTRRSLPGGMDPLGMAAMLEDAVDITYIGEEVRDDQPMHHLRFTLDPEKADLSALLGSADVPAEQTDQIFQDAAISVDTWLGTSDLIPRYQEMTIDLVLPGAMMGLGDANLRLLMDLTMAFTAINQPVTIEAPAMQ
jgi:hypothetical protein